MQSYRLLLYQWHRSLFGDSQPKPDFGFVFSLSGALEDLKFCILYLAEVSILYFGN